MAAVFTFMFPVVFLMVVGTSAGGSHVPGHHTALRPVHVVAMLTFGLIAACYTNLAMAICLRRDSGVLKRMRGTPISIGSYMGGLIGSVIINVVLLAVLVVGIGMAFYHLHFPYHPAAVVLTLLVGIVTFCALGLAVTVIVPNADAAPAVINGIYFPIVFISGVFYPLSNGSVLSRIADWFPVRHLILALVTGSRAGTARGCAPRPRGDAALGGGRPGVHRPPVPVGTQAPLSGSRPRTCRPPGAGPGTLNR